MNHNLILIFTVSDYFSFKPTTNEKKFKRIIITIKTIIKEIDNYLLAVAPNLFQTFCFWLLFIWFSYFLRLM